MVMVMTKEEMACIHNHYRDRMQDIVNLQERDPSDEETLHINADRLLCDMLRKLGYGDVVDLYDKIHKYYA